MNNDTYIEHIDDQLAIRQSNAADTEKLSAFQGKIHAEGDQSMGDSISSWVKDLLSKPHPIINPDDFTVVVDKQTGEIVSSLCLINQQWAIDDIPFGVGRIELVATAPDYRRRGLVKRQMEIAHQWSEERGHLAQSITGIPWYYRQFGYEMTLKYQGGKRGNISNFPDPKKEELPIDCSIRVATIDDVDFIVAIYKQNSADGPITSIINQTYIKYIINDQNKESLVYDQYCVIENAQNKKIGFLFHANVLWGTYIPVQCIEIIEGESWYQPIPAIIAYLKETGEAYGKKADKKLGGISFNIGVDHPIMELLGTKMPEFQPSYTWYLRVPDIVKFLQMAIPALELRLSKSNMVGYSGELAINFYLSGVKVQFENGKIESVNSWEKPTNKHAHASFIEHTFNHLLFGHRSISQLNEVYTDCYLNGAKPEGKPLLNILFPSRPSLVHGVG